GLAAHANDRRDPRPEEPGPDGALMVGAVALRLTAFDAAAIAWIVRRERAQADRRHEFRFANAQDRFRAIALQQRKRKREREQLVRPDRRVVGIDDIEQASGVCVPEALAEFLADGIGAPREIA